MPHNINVAFLLIYNKKIMKLDEELVRKITLAAIANLGEKADLESTIRVVQEVVKSLEEAEKENVDRFKDKDISSDTGRLILTAYGKNRPGVISKITTILANYNCDIQDLTQKILQEYFTMIMLVEISNSNISFNELKENLMKVAAELNIRIIVQHEDVFKYMHRV
jgi:ACT domain-containing protein